MSQFLVVRHAESLANYSYDKWVEENSHLKDTEDYQTRRMDESLCDKAMTNAPLTEKGINQALD